MDIIVKKDILSELQNHGIFRNKEESEKFWDIWMQGIAQNIITAKIKWDGLGTFSPKAEVSQTIETATIIGQIAKASGIEYQRVQAALDATIQYIKTLLFKNCEVQLSDFGSFRIEDRKTQIIKSPKTGNRVMLPAKKFLFFETNKNFLTRIKVPVQFEPEDDLRKQIEKFRTSRILLGFPNVEDLMIRSVVRHFEKSGWKVATCQTQDEIKQSMKAAPPNLIILDTQLSGSQEIIEYIKCSRNSSLSPLILVYPQGADVRKIEGYHICGDENIFQPFDFHQLHNLAEALLWRIGEENTIFRHEIVFQFPTIDEYIDKTSEICNRLFATSGLPEEGQAMLNAAFREALANAAQHGNKHRRDKILEVLYLLDREKIIAAIGDSGAGFDWRSYVRASQENDAVGKARQSQREGRMGGLGIMLMNRCVDKIEYNEAGNVITLLKYLRPPTPKN